MLFDEDRSYVLCMVLFCAMDHVPPFALNTCHFPQFNLFYLLSSLLQGNLASPHQRDSFLFWIPMILAFPDSVCYTLYRIVDNFAFLLPIFTKLSICHVVVWGCWGYSTEQMVYLSLFPTQNLMPINQILFPCIQRIPRSDSHIEYVQPVFGEWMNIW